MAHVNDADTISTQVDRNLTTFRNLEEEELYATVGQLALRDVQYAAPLPKSGLITLGRTLVKTNQQIREVVCINQDLISGTIDVANVTALATLIAPTLGFPPAAVPAAVVAFAVLVLKIGINQYCKGWTEQSSA